MVAKKATTTNKKSVKGAGKAVTKTTVKVAPETKVRTTTVKAVEAPAVSGRKIGLGSFSRMPILAAAIAEFVGTFLLVAVVLATRNEPLWVMFGLFGVVLAVGAVSGAHLNPAITVGAWVTKRVSALRTLAYVLAQLLGAMLAYVTISAFINNAPEVSETNQMLGQLPPEVFTVAAIPAGLEWGIFGAEVLGLAIFGFVFASAYSRRKDITNYALSIGTGFFVALTVAGASAAYLGGAAILNPATAIALQALDFTEVWTLLAYLLAPVIGSVIGFGLYSLISANAAPDTATEAKLL